VTHVNSSNNVVHNHVAHHRNNVVQRSVVVAAVAARSVHNKCAANHKISTLYTWLNSSHNAAVVAASLLHNSNLPALRHNHNMRHNTRHNLARTHFKALARKPSKLTKLKLD
jgi:hypothetical protein